MKITKLALVLFAASAIFFTISAEPEPEGDWTDPGHVVGIFSGHYGSESGQGKAVVNIDNTYFSIPLQYEWGQVAYHLALTAYLKDKAIMVKYETGTDKILRVVIW